MANFKTHVVTAAAASGVAATLFAGAGIAGADDIVTYGMLGTIGGMLPDIDSDESSPIRILFTALGLVGASLAVSVQARMVSIVELWLVALAVYALIRYPAGEIFRRYTVHRGIFHSLVAAGFFGLCAVNLAHYVAGLEPVRAWTSGFFLALGYVVHLVLDEIFAVDLFNSRIKRSFGTAVKLVDLANPKTSVFMIGALLAAYIAAPSAEPFVAIVLDEKTHRSLAERFLPERFAPAARRPAAQEP
jgi:hypothetical protein